MSQFWTDRIKSEGVNLVVEVPLTFQEFKALLEEFIGVPVSDEDVTETWMIANRRILPSDCGSFSGIGHAVNFMFRQAMGFSKYKEDGVE